MSALIWRCSFLLLAVMVNIDAAKIPTGSSSKDEIVATRSFPVFEPVKSVEMPFTNFTGIVLTRTPKPLVMDCGFGAEPEKFIYDQYQEDYFSWEEAWPATGRRVDQFIRVNETELVSRIVPEKEDEFRAEDKNAHVKNRKKRKIFGTDNRHPVPLRVFGHRFPVVSVVKLSTGCTGSLVSPKHVLTAAHCIHDQSDYVEGFNTLKVGLLPNLRMSRKFQWIGVNATFLPNGWLMGNANIASRFDYALLELEETHKKPFFELAISEGRSRAIIHFTAYEDDKPVNTLWFRSCRIRVTDEHVLYHYCDAKPGSSGAGVYTWTKVQGEWNRRLIGVFSGYRWKSFKEWWKKDADFNAAIRLNSLKYAQICGWMGKYAAKSCKQIKGIPST